MNEIEIPSNSNKHYHHHHHHNMDTNGNRLDRDHYKGGNSCDENNEVKKSGRLLRGKSARYCFHNAMGDHFP
jgi:hypothetical protein